MAGGGGSAPWLRHTDSIQQQSQGELDGKDNSVGDGCRGGGRGRPDVWRAAAGGKAGVLTCHETSGWGFIIGSTRDLSCVFSHPNGPPEHYTGKVSQFGVDIGYQASAIIVWGVVAASANLAP